jgi:hypothetical protein
MTAAPAREWSAAGRRQVPAGLAGAAVLSAGWLTAPTPATVLLAATGALALAGSLARPGWPALPTAVALAYLGQLAVAGDPPLPAVVGGVVLLALYLAASEVSETDATGGKAARSAWVAHAPALGLAAAGAVVTALVAGVTVHGVSGPLALGVAAATAAALLRVVLPGGRDPDR